jgi:hypothetical protein
MPRAEFEPVMMPNSQAYLCDTFTDTVTTSFTVTYISSKVVLHDVIVNSRWRNHFLSSYWPQQKAKKLTFQVKKLTSAILNYFKRNASNYSLSFTSSITTAEAEHSVSCSFVWILVHLNPVGRFGADTSRMCCKGKRFESWTILIVYSVISFTAIR